MSDKKTPYDLVTDSYGLYYDELYIKRRYELIRMDANDIEFRYPTKMNDRVNEPVKDYSWTDDFWHLRKTADGYKMRTIESSYTNRDYKSFKKLNVDFISLSEFLEKAEYVGRYFKRTKPIGRDKSYMQEDRSIFLLYLYDNVAIYRIIEEDIFSGDDYEEYKVLSCRYLEDGNYEFYGDYIESFNDKAGVYNAIYEQSFGQEQYNSSKSMRRNY
jgi:hypothetical protein